MDSGMEPFILLQPSLAYERNRFYEWICTLTIEQTMPFIPDGEALRSVNKQLLRDSLLRLYSHHNLEAQASHCHFSEEEDH